MEQSSFLEGPNEITINERLVIKYADTPPTDHSIDAEYYARSLLGFNRAFKKINRKLLGIDIEINIHAEKPGSFEAVVDFFLLKEIAATAIMTSYLSFFGLDFKGICKLSLSLFKMLIDLIKEGKGRKSAIIKLIRDKKLLPEQEKALIDLVNSSKFRVSLDEMTAVLDIMNIEKFEIEQLEHTSVEIDKSDRQFFVTHPEDEITTEVDEKVVSISYLSPEKSRWQFKSGAMEFWAEVADDKFVGSMRDKAVDDISDLKFRATVETTITKEAYTRRKKVERTIFDINEQESLFDGI